MIQKHLVKLRPQLLIAWIDGELSDRDAAQLAQSTDKEQRRVERAIATSERRRKRQK